MPGFRFCRPDDIPLIVQAVNACFDVHYPEQPPLTVPRFLEWQKLEHVHCGNCMLAFEDEAPVAILVGAKRPAGCHVRLIGVAPAWLRRGLATRMVEALGKKVAITGGPWVVAAAPAWNYPARGLLGKAGFRPLALRPPAPGAAGDVEPAEEAIRAFGLTASDAVAIYVKAVRDPSKAAPGGFAPPE